MSVTSSRCWDLVHCGETFGTELIQQLARSGWRLTGIVRRKGSGANLGGAGPVGHFGILVDDDLAEIREQARGTVAPISETKQRFGLIDEGCGGFAGLKGRVIDYILQKRNVGFDAANAEFAQSAVHALASVRELAAPGGHFYQERIVERRDHRAAIGGRAVEADSEARRRTIGMDLAVVGNEIVGWIFGGDAALQREAMHRDVRLGGQVDLRAVQSEVLRDLDLAAHDIDASHHLGDGMLHLNAWIHFDEIPAAGVGIHQEFDSSSVSVSGGFGERDGGVGERRSDGRSERNGGRYFDNFLIAALDRAIALEQVQDIAVMIGQDLDFYVAGAPDVALQKDGIVSERRAGFLARFLHACFKFLGLFDDAHASAAAAERRFDDQGVADFCAQSLGFGEIGHGIGGARDHRDSSFHRQVASRGLVPQEFQEIGAGADEGDAGPLTGAR